ncbi:MAG: 16S rRNA (adenine(1518)-N(6)/adenine(1519)-N(6))-dimethyltransferase RsmA [Treponema sp.]
MYNIDYNSPSSIKSHLKFFNFAMQKKWGQNFLINEKIRKEIVHAIGDIKEKSVWEVGPGLGAMTVLLKEHNANITLFEIDKGFSAFLKKQFESEKGIKMVEGDVLKTWKEELKKSGIPPIFFGCLPYNITIELLLSFFQNITIFEKMVITIQKEVADKILSKKNAKAYSPLSIFSSYFYDIKRLLNISPSAFWPQPHVTSSTLIFTKKEKRTCNNERLFISMVHSLFASRRRTIKNNLSQWLEAQNIEKKIDLILQEAKINPLARAESLELDDFIKFINVIELEHAD